jgi:hypothetical protein
VKIERQSAIGARFLSRRFIIKKNRDSNYEIPPFSWLSANWVATDH